MAVLTSINGSVEGVASNRAEYKTRRPNFGHGRNIIPHAKSRVVEGQVFSLRSASLGVHTQY